MIIPILIVVLLTFMPLVELRLSIPVGILSGSVDLPFGITLSGLGMNFVIVFVIAVLANILLGFALFHIWEFLDERLRHSFLKKPYSRFMNKAHRKLKKFVDKYGVLGVALFIGIPFPGSGVYTGSLGAFVLGLDKKHFYKATIIGVLIAGILVTAITMTGISLFS
jgi:uncharacterized membrane protein